MSCLDLEEKNFYRVLVILFLSLISDVRASVATRTLRKSEKRRGGRTNGGGYRGRS